MEAIEQCMSKNDRIMQDNENTHSQQEEEDPQIS